MTMTSYLTDEKRGRRPFVSVESDDVIPDNSKRLHFSVQLNEVVAKFYKY